MKSNDHVNSRTNPLFRKNSPNGFGLLELVIAMTILAVGMLGIVKLQMQSGFGNASSRNISAAVNLARSKLEYLKRIGSYSTQEGSIVELVDPESANPATAIDMDDWPNPDFSEGPFNEAHDGSSKGKIFSRSWNVVDNYPLAGFKTIRMRVSWTSFQGAPKYVDMETQVGQKDLTYFQ